ncbi:cytoplasmic protein [Desulfonema ishimotonii]|uniref:Cytoplasmic protein n=1 Tax=Desulfonema ishimotonii TaxID=45657 RepID=A0A401G0I0_9BACT|nr:DsrE family protein [Desulfonema ishimotonii]GBC62707.1 cytoplasmic protein [Desulfonema ishimotonii]
MKKIALFVFNGDPMCFIHVLMNALNMHQKGNDARIVIEGSATALPPELAKADHPLHGLWEKAVEAGLVAGVCEACSRKTGTLEAAKAQGLALLNEMNGHPSIARFQDDGYEIITF